MVAEELGLNKAEMLAIEQGKRKFPNGIPKRIEKWLQGD